MAPDKAAILGSRVRIFVFILAQYFSMGFNSEEYGIKIITHIQPY